MTDPSNIDPFGEPEAEKAPEEPKTAPTKAPAKEVKEKAPRATGVALRGSLVNMSDYDAPKQFPGWPSNTRDDMFIPDEEVDYTDLSTLNRDINRARSMLFRVKNELANARRVEVESALAYRQAYNRAFMGLSGGTEAIRKTMAEVMTEDLYTDLMIAQNIVKEQTSLSYNVSKELETLKTLSDNLRKQMSIQ